MSDESLGFGLVFPELFVEVDFVSLNTPRYRGFGVAFERWVASKQHEQKHAQAPHVAFLGVAWRRDAIMRK